MRGDWHDQSSKNSQYHESLKPSFDFVGPFLKLFSFLVKPRIFFDNFFEQLHSKLNFFFKGNLKTLKDFTQILTSVGNKEIALEKSCTLSTLSRYIGDRMRTSSTKIKWQTVTTTLCHDLVSTSFQILAFCNALTSFSNTWRWWDGILRQFMFERFDVSILTKTAIQAFVRKRKI